MASARVKALIDDLKNLDGNEYEEFLKGLEIVDEAREDEEIEPETDDNEGKEETYMTKDEKQIAEAKKDIEEKGKDTQTEKDRIDESVGEQEKLDGNENSQNAKDRVDESEGAKKADEEIKKHEEEDEKKIPNMIREILREELKPILSEALKEYGLSAGKTEKEASEADKKALAGIESIYNS